MKASETEVFEFGIGNAECGKEKRGQSFEFGIGNAECGKKKRGQKTEDRKQRIDLTALTYS